jgi:hypothetical protein
MRRNRPITQKPKLKKFKQSKYPLYLGKIEGYSIKGDLDFLVALVKKLAAENKYLRSLIKFGVGK